MLLRQHLRSFDLRRGLRAYAAMRATVSGLLKPKH